MARRAYKLNREGVFRAKEAFAIKNDTQGQIASKLQISRTSVSKFLNGKPVAVDIYIRICEALNLNWRDNLDDEKNHLPPDKS